MKKENPFSKLETWAIDNARVQMRAEIYALEERIKLASAELARRAHDEARGATQKLRAQLNTSHKIAKSNLSRAKVDTNGHILVLCNSYDRSGWLVAKSVGHAAQMLKNPENSFTGVGR